MNLIEQQNILRGLADDALKNEMGGNVPPYLVLAEVNRRKSARERYEAANAKYRANQPTVAEELMGQMPQAGIDTALTGGGMRAPGPMAMPAGIDAAMTQQQPQAFANGGVVGYEGGGIVDLVKAYNARLSSTDEDRKNAQRMALMNIGAQIMAGRSRNTLSNIGSGLSAALPSYQQSMERLNTQEMQGLRDQIDLARQMEQDRLAQANMERDARLDEMRIKEAERKAEYAGLPPDAAAIAQMDELKNKNPELYQQLVDARLATSNAQADAATTEKIAAVISDVEKQIPFPVYSDKRTGEPIFDTQEEYNQAVAMRNKLVVDNTIARIRAELGQAAADAYQSRIMRSAPPGVVPSTGTPTTGTSWEDYY